MPYIFESLTLKAFLEGLRVCAFVHALVCSELRVLPVRLLAVRTEEGRVEEISICSLCIILLLIGTQ